MEKRLTKFIQHLMEKNLTKFKVATLNETADKVATLNEETAEVFSYNENGETALCCKQQISDD